MINEDLQEEILKLKSELNQIKRENVPEANHRRIRRQPVTLEDDEVNKIAEYLLKDDNSNPTTLGRFLKIRDYYAWKLLNALGLRPRELLQLTWNDIDFENRKITLCPYWNKQRIDIPAILTKPAMVLIVEYRKQIEALGLDCKYLFPAASTWQPLTTNNFARRLLTAAKKCGLAKIQYYTSGGQPKYNIKPYTARHNFCTKVWKGTHDTTCVQKLARHLKLESSQHYIHTDNQDKIDIVDSIFKMSEQQKEVKNDA